MKEVCRKASQSRWYLNRDSKEKGARHTQRKMPCEDTDTQREENHA